MDNHQTRRIEHYRVERNRSFSRGFAIGFISCALIICAFTYGQREAYGATRPAPAERAQAERAPAERAKPTSTSHGTSAKPPHTRTWLRIGMCEQPKRGISWRDIKTDKDRIKSIAWHQTRNYSFPGGLGLTRDNWRTFRRPSQRNIDLMSSATITEQLWAAERLWRWAEKTYPGAGYTAWECSRIIGWSSSDPKDALR